MHSSNVLPGLCERACAVIRLLSMMTARSGMWPALVDVRFSCQALANRCIAAGSRRLDTDLG